MSMTLRLYGIRKLRKEEVRELSGKTAEEIRASQYFRELFPRAPYNTWYECRRSDKGIRGRVHHMLTRVKTADGKTVWVFCREELAYYWRNLSHEDSTVYEIMNSLDSYFDWDREFNVVPVGIASSYFNCGWPSCGEPEELILLSYG